MTKLLDTHAILWYVLGESRLTDLARETIQNSANRILISPASLWEVAIKVGLGKLKLERPFDDFIDLCLNNYGFELLPILPSHVSELSRLPEFKDHRDPFDRLLVSQAISEQIGLISSDEKLSRYGVDRIW